MPRRHRRRPTLLPRDERRKAQRQRPCAFRPRARWRRTGHARPKPASGSVITGMPSLASMPSDATSAANKRRRRRAQAPDLDAAARGDLDDAVAVASAPPRTGRRRHRAGSSIRRASTGRASRRRSPSAPRVPGRRRGAWMRLRARSFRSLRPNRRKARVDVVAARMPQAEPARGVEPLRDRARGARDFPASGSRAPAHRPR